MKHFGRLSGAVAAAICAGCLLLAGGRAALAQAAPGTQALNEQDSSAAVTGTVAGNSYQAAPQAGSARGAARTAATSTVEVPAGTRVLLALRNGVNTKTAQPGDGVYLASTFPVVVGNRVAIPAGVYVQGMIDKVVRPGRGRGRAAVRMHFTTMIFPNGSVATIPGVVGGVPGSAGQRVKDQEGTIEEAGSNKGKDAGTVLGGAVAGTTVGGIAGAASGHPGEGIAAGALAGGVGGLLVTLFTRGNDIMLEQGQAIEMVLERPLLLTAANLDGVTGAGFAPVEPQRQPLAKPRRIGILCPLGGLGCSN